MMRRLAMLAVLFPVSGWSAGPTRGIEITPFAGYRIGGEFERSVAEGAEPVTLDLDDAASYGLIVNWPAEENTEWEIYLGRQATAIQTEGAFLPGEEPPTDLDISYLQVGGTYYFEGEQARPYIVATVGASRFEPDESSYDSETFFAFGIGGGYKVAPTSRFGLRLEGRVFGSLVDSDEAVFCQSGGAASGCLIAVNGNIVWQWEVLAGVTFRL